MTQFNQALSYDDVLVVPQYSDIESRSEVSLISELDPNNRFELPIIASPMDTVVESEMALALAAQGALGVIHRYNSIIDQKEDDLGCCERDAQQARRGCHCYHGRLYGKSRGVV